MAIKIHAGIFRRCRAYTYILRPRLALNNGDWDVKAVLAVAPRDRESRSEKS